MTYLLALILAAVAYRIMTRKRDVYVSQSTFDSIRLRAVEGPPEPTGRREKRTRSEGRSSYTRSANNS